MSADRIDRRLQRQARREAAEVRRQQRTAARTAEVAEMRQRLTKAQGDTKRLGDSRPAQMHTFWWLRWLRWLFGRR